MNKLRNTIRGARAEVTEKLSEPFMSSKEVLIKSIDKLNLQDNLSGAVINVEDILKSGPPKASLEALRDDLTKRDWEGSGMGAANPTEIINSLFHGKGTLDKHHEPLDIERKCFIDCGELMKAARAALLKEAEQAQARAPSDGPEK
jgi:hypothetical protein